MTQIPSTKCIVIGAGFSGIATGCQFKQKLNFHDFVIYDRSEMYGGTWFVNTYPGCGVDIPSLFYSLSFAPNPDFSRLFPDQPEVLEYIKRTAREFDLEKHIKLNTSWVESAWSEDKKTWRSKFQNTKTGEEFYQESKILISAAGGLVEPNKLNIEGSDQFEGDIVHSARWDHSVSLKDKNVCIIGNGCSGVQIVPAILPEVKHLTQFIRSAQWIFPRKNHEIPSRLKWGYRNVPGLHLLLRTLIFLIVEHGYDTMLLTNKGELQRKRLAKKCTDFIHETAPEKYWDLLTPKFSVGCKRRIYDPGYIESLNRENMHLTNDPVVRMEKKAVITKSGDRYDCDVFIAANGFAPMHFEQPIRGRSGQTLQEHWRAFGGQEAYKSTALNDFPNFFMIAGPNSSTSYGSAVFSIEGSIDLVTRIIRPLIKDDTADEVEISLDAEKSWAKQMQAALKQRVMSFNCHSYYVDRETGWNYFNYPWTSYHWWYTNRFPDMKVWKYKRTERQQKKVNRRRVLGSLVSMASAAVAGGAVWYHFVS